MSAIASSNTDVRSTSSSTGPVLHLGTGLLGLTAACGARDGDPANQGNPARIAPNAASATCTACETAAVFEEVADEDTETSIARSLPEAGGTAGPQHEVRTLPTAGDVLAIAEHHGTAFVEVDGWVNTLIAYPGGSTVVYKAPTDAAVC